MALPATEVTLHPMDVYNICRILRRRKEVFGPRAMRYVLKPGDPVRIVFEPWNIELECPRSIYEGPRDEEIRVWGRRRIHILERLIPVARKFTVHLLGKGMPSFYTADLGGLTFTLGLSGWTANDWSTAGNFDLLAPRADVDDATKVRVFTALQENWYEAPDALAQRLQLDRSVVLGALAAYTQAGRAIWDHNKQVYRVRELSREPLPMDKLRFASEREQSATQVIEQGGVKIGSSFAGPDDILILDGTVKNAKQKKFKPSLKIDTDERIIEAECSCNWHQQNRLRKGPCEHILALRMFYARRQTPKKFLTIS